jgi:hypothetical protein
VSKLLKTYSSNSQLIERQVLFEKTIQHIFTSEKIEFIIDSFLEDVTYEFYLTHDFYELVLRRNYDGLCFFIWEIEKGVGWVNFEFLLKEVFKLGQSNRFFHIVNTIILDKFTRAIKINLYNFSDLISLTELFNAKKKDYRVERIDYRVENLDTHIIYPFQKKSSFTPLIS